MHEKKGFPAETVDGETVLIVGKSLDSNTMKETLTDTEGREYTRGIDGADKRLVPLDAAEVEETAPGELDGEAVEDVEEDSADDTPSIDGEEV